MDDQKLQHIPVDHTKKIVKVSMYVYTFTGELLRLKMVDNDNQPIVDHKFREGDWSLCEWFHRDVPQDRDIIGLYCNNTIDDCYIKSLGFITWKPNIASADGSRTDLGKHKHSMSDGVTHVKKKLKKKKKETDVQRVTMYDAKVYQLLHANSQHRLTCEWNEITSSKEKDGKKQNEMKNG